MNKWSRKKMKEIGKARMKANYWKAVLIALILLVLGGIGGAASGASSAASTATGTSSMVGYSTVEDQSMKMDDDFDEVVETDHQASIIVVTIAMVLVFLLIFAVVLAVVMVINAFLINPFVVGGSRFFYRNLEQDAEVKEVCYAFDRGYRNTVKIMFFRDLYTVLWSLLFIIPGIIKYYEYMMIPYILGENENITKEEAFETSKRLMRGNKWRAFVLDLSFIPWMLLSGVTLGIAGVFYVNPYIYSTGAAFYQAVKEEEMLRMVETEA